MTLSELKWPRGEAHRQPAVPGRGEQVVQREQPGLQRQQRHHHGAQHRRVPGQPVQPAQRLPARQLIAQPAHHHPGHQRHAQLCCYSRLALTQNPPRPIRPKHLYTYVPVRSCSLLTFWSATTNTQSILTTQMQPAAVWSTGLFWPKECPNVVDSVIQVDWREDVLQPPDPGPLTPPPSYFCAVYKLS